MWGGGGRGRWGLGGRWGGGGASGEIVGERPVILVDDVMSELDQSRREYLLNHLTGSQIFITCCDKGYFSRLEQGRVFKMEKGRLEQE